MFFKNLLFLLATTLLLGSTVQAQELYVRNRAFKGSVVQEGGQTWVDLHSFAEAIRWQLKGDDASGYALSSDGSGEPSATGKVSTGSDSSLYRTVNGETLVELKEISRQVGAKLVENRDLGTIDVNLVKKKGEVASAGADNFEYTLIEYSDPSSPICQYFQATLQKSKERYGKEMRHILCDVRKKGVLAKYMAHKKTKDGSYPEMSLINARGEVLFQLRGNHVIEDKLAASLRRSIKKSRRRR